MAVSIESLKTPLGVVEGYMFPKDTPQALDARLSAFLTKGLALVAAAEAEDSDKDELVTNYVYYRVFDAVYKRMVMEPAQVTLLDQGGQQWSKEQLAAMAEQRLYYAGLLPVWMLPQIVEVSEPVVTPTTVAPRTLNVPIQVVF